jgi:uncharacterized protein (TIGR02646 family)
MRKIVKTSAPANYIALITQLQYREQDISAGVHHSTRGRDLFDNLKLNAEYILLKRQLVEEQGYICCYCNCRIGITGETTEHILPIHTHKRLLGEYNNLLVSCNHSRTQRHTGRTYPDHCDASKKRQILPFTPLDDRTNCVFEYEISDGSMTSMDADGITVLNILQLDCTKLRDNRLAALEILYDGSGNLLPDEDLENIFCAIDKKDSSGMYHPYFKCIEFCAYYLLFPV